MRIEIGPMVPADARGVGALHHRAWVDTYAAALPVDYWDTWTTSRSVSRWRRILAEPTPRRVLRLVAKEGRQVVGFGVRGPARDRPEVAPSRAIELWSIYVESRLHGSGIGQGLLEACLGPGEPAELWVWSGNARAIAFYRRSGFEPDGATFVDDRFPQLDHIRLGR